MCVHNTHTYYSFIFNESYIYILYTLSIYKNTLIYKCLHIFKYRFYLPNMECIIVRSARLNELTRMHDLSLNVYTCLNITDS